MIISDNYIYMYIEQEMFQVFYKLNCVFFYKQLCTSFTLKFKKRLVHIFKS